MFDVGFSELGVIGLVALIVIGPEQLPRVARTAGHLMGRLRRYVSDVKSDISREMEIADLQRISEEVKDSARSIESSIREQVAGLESEMQQSIATPEIHQLAADVIAPVSRGDAPEPIEPMTADQADADAGPEVVPPLAETVMDVPVDPNQMDLFGEAPAVPSPLPEKQ